MRRLLKNKVVFGAVIIATVTILYFTVEKIMDNYWGEEEIIVQEDSEIYNEESEISDSGENVDNDEGTKKEDVEIDVMSEIEQGFSVTENNKVLNEGDDEENSEILADEHVKENYTSSSDNKIYVYITGEVNHCGVVVLNDGSRIIDAINAAGGTTSKANISKINLVYVLDDGMKVNIPNDNDLKNDPYFKYVTLGSGDNSNDSNNNENISHHTQDEVYESKVSIVNINSASQTELETLPGIGPSLALKIINYRKENGLFSAIEDIKNVSGIGDSKFEDIKDYITV